MADDIKCPICGSETTIRTAKKGNDVGKSFYICDRYPECKGRVEYTEDVHQEEDEYEKPTNKGKPVDKTGEKVLLVGKVPI